MTSFVLRPAVARHTACCGEYVGRFFSDCIRTAAFSTSCVRGTIGQVFAAFVAQLWELPKHCLKTTLSHIYEWFNAAL